MITVELTDEEAMLFRLFRQHQDLFQKFMKARLFEVRAEAVMLHFDSNGILRLITKKKDDEVIWQLSPLT